MRENRRRRTRKLPLNAFAGPVTPPKQTRNSLSDTGGASAGGAHAE